MSNVSWAVLTVQMTCCTRHVVSVTERPHLKVIKARLEWVAELVEGHRVVDLDRGERPNLGAVIETEGQTVGGDVYRVPVGPGQPHVSHDEADLSQF